MDHINDYISLRNLKGRESFDYAGTTEDARDVQIVRDYVKSTNKMLRRVGMPTVTVKVGTRLGKENPNAWKYSGVSGPYIRMEDAQRFDIYLKTN